MNTIWIITEDATHQVSEYNVNYNKESGKFEFWITKPTGQSKKLMEGTEDEMEFIKSFVDYVIVNKKESADLRPENLRMVEEQLKEALSEVQ